MSLYSSYTRRWQLIVRDYHQTYYVPHNLSLIVSGKLSRGTETLLSVVQNEIEPSIIAHGQNKGPKPPGWKRPFVETPSARRQPIAELIERTVEFPEKDESTGELMINYIGPRDDDFIGSKASTVCPVFLHLHLPWRRQLKFWAHTSHPLLLRLSIKNS